jgi:hypothetical protein
MTLKNLNKKIYFYLLTLMTTLVGFRGYLDPRMVRVFGDISANTSLSTNPDKFQYYNIQFFEELLPSFTAPYSYQLQHFRFSLESVFHINKYNLDWVLIFLPFLVSVVLCAFFFFKISKRPFYGYIGWLFYTFSTFILFVSSIHTPIATALNFFLFYIYLTILYLEKPTNISNILNYIFQSSVVLIFSCFNDLRMVLVSLPVLIPLLLITVINFNKKSNHPKSLLNFFCAQASIIIVIALNFWYILLNLSTVFQASGQLTSRAPWGDQYFSLLNSLSISHPFWNNGQAINFIYNRPSIVHMLNIGLFLLVLYCAVRLWKDLKYWLFLLLPMFFFIFLSKQNSAPFENIYNILYKFPYFNFSREASKYYYGFLILWSVFLILILNNVNKLKYGKILSRSLLFFSSVPLIFNFIIFSTGSYGNSTKNYMYKTAVYDSLNDEISNRELIGKESRVLWIPLMGSLQDNTVDIKHFSYNSVENLYPLENLDKNSRNYLRPSLADINFQKYLELMGFDYLVLPDLENEPSILTQMIINYPDFRGKSLLNYVEKTLPIEKIYSKDGYNLYQFKWSDSRLSVMSTNLSPEYNNTGQIQIIDAKNDVNSLQNYSKINYQTSIHNCNNNFFKGLDFDPKDRISIIHTKIGTNIKMFARYQELPCFDISIKDDQISEDENPILNILGNNQVDLEVIVFQEGKEVNHLSIKKTNQQKSLPINCSKNCNIRFYLRGKSSFQEVSTNFTFQLLSTVNTQVVKQSIEDIGVLRQPIKDFNKTIIQPSLIEKTNNYYNFLVLPYQYNKGYEIVLSSGQIIKTIPNNHNLNIFNVQGKDLEGSYIKYNPEISIQPHLELTNWINGVTISVSTILVAHSLYKGKNDHSSTREINLRSITN